MEWDAFCDGNDNNVKQTGFLTCVMCLLCWWIKAFKKWLMWLKKLRFYCFN